jgi:hypothetical protein
LRRYKLRTDSGEDLNRILIAAQSRSRYDARSYFKPSDTLIKFGEKVADWFSRNNREMTLPRFRQMYFDIGVSKLGFRDFIEKIVPRLYTMQEFEMLMEALGYDVTDEEEPDEYADNPLHVLVVGSDSWDAFDTSFIWKVLKQLPPSTIIYTNARSKVDAVAAHYWDSYGSEVRDVANPKKMLKGIDFVLGFHENPRASEHTFRIARKAKDKGVGVKLLTGEKIVELDIGQLAGTRAGGIQES